MWELIRNTGAVILDDVAASSSLKTAAALNDLLVCSDPDKSLAVLSSVDALRRIYGGDITCIKPVPNRETAFTLRIVSVLTDRLTAGDTLAAADTALALSRLPELSELSDETAVEVFNREYIIPVNEKYSAELLPLLRNW